MCRSGTYAEHSVVALPFCLQGVLHAWSTYKIDASDGFHILLPVWSTVPAKVPCFDVLLLLALQDTPVLLSQSPVLFKLQLTCFKALSLALRQQSGPTSRLTLSQYRRFG